jgi:hypothetical protein
MKLEDIENAFPGADMMIETGERVPWNWTLDGDEIEFVGVDQSDLDEIKDGLGEVEIRKRSGENFGTVQLRDVPVRAEVLQQMILICEKFNSGKDR